jgi:glycosyltransferase involved in cell wall biosynthesis
MRIGIFIDGTFIPERDGASARFAHLPAKLTEADVEVVVFHCFRGWSHLESISREPYTTYFFSPETYYSDLPLLADLIRGEGISTIQANDLETMHRLGFPLADELELHLVYEAHYHSSTLATQLLLSPDKIISAKCLEAEVSRHVDEIIVFTHEDRRRWVELTEADDDRISVVPYGVNCISSNSSNAPERVPYLVFLGNMYFEPNRRAVERIAYKILPGVKKFCPAARCMIVGDAPQSLISACRGYDIDFTGEVPDLTPWLQKGSVGISPISEGSGVRVKIMQYLACGIPAVATSIAAEGLDFPALFVEDDYDRYARLCADLLLRDGFDESRLDATLRLLKSEYTWGAIAYRASAVYRKVVSRRPRGRPGSHACSFGLPIWLDEVLRKGRFPDAHRNAVSHYRYGVAAGGKVDIRH